MNQIDYLDKTGSNLFKSDQVDSSRFQYGANLFRLNEIGSRRIRLIIWIKADKTGSNWIKSDIQLDVTIKIGSN